MELYIAVPEYNWVRQSRRNADLERWKWPGVRRWRRRLAIVGRQRGRWEHDTRRRIVRRSQQWWAKLCSHWRCTASSSSTYTTTASTPSRSTPTSTDTVTPQPRCFLFQLFIIYSKHDAFDSREYYVTGPAPRNSLLWDLWDLQSGASLPI